MNIGIMLSDVMAIQGIYTFIRNFLIEYLMYLFKINKLLMSAIIVVNTIPPKIKLG